MADVKATGRDWDVTPPDNSKAEYGYDEKAGLHDPRDVQIYSDPEHKDESLHRGLKARQISMIAIGGAVGKSDQYMNTFCDYPNTPQVLVSSSELVLRLQRPVPLLSLLHTA